VVGRLAHAREFERRGKRNERHDPEDPRSAKGKHANEKRREKLGYIRLLGRGQARGIIYASSK